jgi:hypothetical protein
MPPAPGEHIVAKIFDPLYRDHHQDDIDPFLCADAAYANEVAAYAKLAKLHGGPVPRYYGSYTFYLWEPSAAATRAVRVVRMEHVRGCALRDLDPRHFSQGARQAIIGDIIDAETAVFAAGVYHRDLYPRKVLVVGALLSLHCEAQQLSFLPLAQPTPSTTNGNSHDPCHMALKEPHVPLSGVSVAGHDSGLGNCLGGRTSVVLIDFGKVSVQNDQAQWPYNTLFLFMGIHIPFLLRWHEAWWSNRQQKFEAWIDWEWQSWLEDRYRHRQGDVTQEMRSQRLPEEMLEQLQIRGGDADMDDDEDGWGSHGTDMDCDKGALLGWCGDGADMDHAESDSKNDCPI